MPFPNETPLEEVIKYIRNATTGPGMEQGIPIYVDPVGLQEASVNHPDDESARSYCSRYNTRNPMGRVGRPGELANMAAFLMSDEVEYINGEVIAIDGAMGIMGNGTFSNMMAYSESDWQRIREQIQSTNAADKAKRS